MKSFFTRQATKLSEGRPKIFRKIFEVMESFHNKSPKAKWLFYQKITSFTLEMGALNILDPNFKLVPRSFVVGLILAEYTVFAPYTFWYSRHDFLVACQTFSVVGFVMQVKDTLIKLI